MRFLFVAVAFISGCAVRRPPNVETLLSREKPRDACRQVDEDIRNGYKTWECIKK